jgi:hypothetical protein
MAKLKSSESKQGGSNSWIPKLRYRARCIGTKNGKSGGGHNMTTLSCEVIDDTVEQDGTSYEVAGREFKLFLMHVQKESWGQARVEEVCKRLGVELETEDDGMGGEAVVYDDELHKEYFHGREFDIILHSEERIKRKEKKPGQKVGDPILDGEGNEIKDGWMIQADLLDIPEHCNPTLNEEIAAQPY